LIRDTQLPTALLALAEELVEAAGVEHDGSRG
jgi:hypothetical protein